MQANKHLRSSFFSYRPMILSQLALHVQYTSGGARDAVQPAAFRYLSNIKNSVLTLLARVVHGVQV